jgi:hypothetical protein
MKIRIVRANGDVIEAEGTPAECREFCGETSRPAISVPVYPAPTYVPAFPYWEYVPPPTWTGGSTCGHIRVTTADIARGIAEGSISHTRYS